MKEKEKKDEEKMLQKEKRRDEVHRFIQNISHEELKAIGIEGPSQLQYLIETGQLQDKLEKVNRLARTISIFGHKI